MQPLKLIVAYVKSGQSKSALRFLYFFTMMGPKEKQYLGNDASSRDWLLSAVALHELKLCTRKAPYPLW